MNKAQLQETEDILSGIEQLIANDADFRKARQHPYDAGLDEMSADDGDDTEPDDDVDDDSDDDDAAEQLSTGNNRKRLGLVVKEYGRSSSHNANAPAATAKFNTVVQRIAAARKMNLAAATTVARRENPILYQAMKDAELPTTTDQRLVVPSVTMVKSANEYEALVQQELQKGISTRELAEQRVCYAHPHLARAREDIAKSADTVTTRFHQRVTDVMQKRGVERCEAMRIVRKSAPSLYVRYQEV